MAGLTLQSIKNINCPIKKNYQKPIIDKKILLLIALDKVLVLFLHPFWMALLRYNALPFPISLNFRWVFDPPSKSCLKSFNFLNIYRFRHAVSETTSINFRHYSRALNLRCWKNQSIMNLRLLDACTFCFDDPLNKSEALSTSWKSAPQVALFRLSKRKD